jgi:hypothetical protein
MSVHRLRIRRRRGDLSVIKDTWDALPDASSIETTIHEWPATSEWVGLKPAVSFEMKQGLFHQQSQELHDWTDEVWSQDKIRWEFKSWKCMRDAEHHDMILMKRDPKWVVNPRVGRIIGFVHASRADEGKARIARILLELDMATALYRFGSRGFKELLVEEYARPYRPERQENAESETTRVNIGLRDGTPGKS